MRELLRDAREGPLLPHDGSPLAHDPPSTRVKQARGAAVVTTGRVAVTTALVVVATNAVLVARGAVPVARGAVLVARGAVLVARGAVLAVGAVLPIRPESGNLGYHRGLSSRRRAIAAAHGTRRFG